MKNSDHDPGDNVAQFPAQPFMSHPDLAAIIEELGWKAAGISINKWCRLLSEINAAITNSIQTERDRCSSIVASYGTNDTGIQRLQQNILDRIAFPENIP